MLEGRLKSATEEVEKEKALKEVSKATLWDQVIALAIVERRAIEAERAHTAGEKRMTELEGKLDEAELKFAQAESVVLARDREVADLKAALGQSKDKFYNMGFADAENSSKPIMLESWRYGFKEGWIAAVNALGLPEDSPFRDPN